MITRENESLTTPSVQLRPALVSDIISSNFFNRGKSFISLNPSGKIFKILDLKVEMSKGMVFKDEKAVFIFYR